MCIESVFEQFWWPSYLTSKLTSLCVNLIMWIYFFVNLLHSLCVWLFDNLTSFWHFDIFLTFWHLFDILTSFWHFDIFKLKPPQPVTGLFLCFVLHFISYGTTKQSRKVPLWLCDFISPHLYLIRSPSLHLISSSFFLVFKSKNVVQEFSFVCPVCLCVLFVCNHT